MEQWLSFVFAIGFIMIHFFSKSMNFINDTPRSRFLSLAGGIAVAYVFVHLLPELNEHQEVLEEAVESGVLMVIESHAYILALVGLAVFYGLEKMVKHPRNRENNRATRGVFWIHITSFFFYNTLIGYLLVREEYNSEWGMFFFFLAMGVHFLTNDHSLRKDHKEIYDRYGRWLLTVAILLGWTIGVFIELQEVHISLLTAFLAGGIILNVLKEELPEERSSSFIAFFSGMLGYSILLLLA